MKKYDPAKIEKKWQETWEKDGLHHTQEDSKKQKCYVLDMFPYPSGEGLHVGHAKGYVATDIYSRYKKMTGHNVLHPMGWDAFGLPAEQFAIKNKIHPRVAVDKNTKRYKEQLLVIGLSYDWEREINTTDPEYYKWTQWMFLQMYKKGLAYESYEPINWCSSCKTGLANEDLEDGKCERCDSVVEKKPMRQWVLRITDYADRMLEGLDELDWPESIKELQRNWIGRSEGSEIDFNIKDTDKKFTVFTTRPDTLFGATYCVVAPELKLVDEIKGQIENWDEVEKYRKEIEKKTEIERTAEGKEKTGVELKGIKAINPANNEDIPIFIADYVLAHYGTGAIMAVPAHDERDFEFANKYKLHIRQVVARKKEQIRGVGALLETKNGTFLFQERDDDAPVRAGMIAPFGGGREENEEILDCLKRELQEELSFRINDADTDFIGDFESHNWPESFLSIFHIRNVDVSKLELHEGKSIIEMTIEQALENKMVTDFTKEALKVLAKNNWNAFVANGSIINSGEFDGMESEEAKKAITKFVGGKEKVTYKLRDWVFSRQRYWGEPIPIIHCDTCGIVPVPESELPVELPNIESYEPTDTGESPLADIEEWVNTKCPKCEGTGKRETNTMPQWAGSSWYYLRYIDPKNENKLADKKKEKYWSPVDIYVGGAEHATRHLIYARFWHKFLYDIGEVNYDEPFKRLQHVGLIGAEDGRKMSKRYGNVINPDDIVATYGADTLRLYEMFMGPFDQGVQWSTDSIVGPRRFIEKIWRLKEKVAEVKNENLESSLHKTIKKVGEDIESFDFNTAVSQMMIFVNEIEKEKSIEKEQYETFLRLIAPFAPHVTEELWSELGHETSIHLEDWPSYDEGKTKDESITIVVQVNGKVREKIVVDADLGEDAIKQLVLESEVIKKWLDGQEPKKIIYIEGKLVNIVI